MGAAVEVSTSFDRRARQAELVALVIDVDPVCAMPLFKWAVEGWAADEALAEWLRREIDASGPLPHLLDHLKSTAHRAMRQRTALALSPKSRRELLRLLEEVVPGDGHMAEAIHGDT